MKKNIKLSEKQAQMVLEKMSNFKSDIFEKVNAELSQCGGASLAAPFSKTFVQAGWTRSSR